MRIRRLLFVLMLSAGVCAPLDVTTQSVLLTGAGTGYPPNSGVTLPADANQVFLSDRTWSQALNGFGPAELDMSLGDFAAGDGHLITMAGLTYAKGIGAHAASILRYALNRQCTAFRAVIGVDDEVGSNGSVVFKVFVNGASATDGGVLLYTSSTLTGTSAVVPLDLDVTNRYELTLAVENSGDSDAYDHADWAFARVICSTPAGTAITAGSNIQTALTAGTTNQSFVLKTGTHTVATPLTFKNGQKLYGEFGTLVSGGATLGGWTQTTTGCAAGCWYVTGQTQGSASVDNSDNACWKHPAGSGTDYPCKQIEDVYFVGAPLTGTLTLAEGNGDASRFFFDYAADRIYVYQDPAQRTIETNRYTTPFSGTATGVEFHNLTVQNFTGNGVELANGWKLYDSTVRNNHGTGVYGVDNSVAHGVYTHQNGYQGYGGAGATITAEYGENSHNNHAHYNPFLGGGGSKWVFTSALLVDHMWSHHNFGPGFWTDISNINVTYSNNTIEDNDRAGIFHEISYDALITGNTIKRNGLFEGATSVGYGAGIQIVNSRNVEVTGNTLSGNAAGIKAFIDGARTGAGDPNATSGTWEVTGLNVHSNTVCTVDGPEMAGLNAAAGGYYYTAPANNHFTLNVWSGLTYPSSYFVWQAIGVTFATWQSSYGMDAAGSYTVVGSCP